MNDATVGNTPHSGDVVIYEEHGLAYLLSALQRTSHLTPLAFQAAIRRADMVAAVHQVDVWLTEDGMTYQRVAHYRPSRSTSSKGEAGEGYSLSDSTFEPPFSTAPVNPGRGSPGQR